MKGVSFVTDDNNRKIAVQIDLQTLEQYQEDIKDLLDGIIASLREETVSPDDILKNSPKNCG